MNFDLGSDSASKNVSDILRDVPVTDDYSKKSVNLGFHVHALEEEMKKIEAFKRELPHCMHLLRDAIERLKEESGGEVVVEELGFEGRAKESNDMMEKKTWMSSVQLCTPVSRNQDSVFQLRSRYLEGEGSGNGEFRKEGGAFLAFKKGTAGIEELSLSVGEGGDLTLNGFGREKLEQPHQQEQQKKQRRCWSPELHKIFVDALHQLGGAQTATPKQIRELMKVDGLTNDEVKSHLQKYRIHIKRVGAGEQIAGSPKGPLQGGKAGRGGGDSLEDEDDGKSESHGWTSCKLQNPNL